MKKHLKWRLSNQYLQADQLIEGLSTDQLCQGPPSGKWTICENLAHLGRYQEFFEERIKKILTGKRPRFGRYKAEEDPLFESWLDFNTAEIILKTKKKRVEIAAKLLKLSDEQICKTGIHPKLGEMDIIAWTEFFLLHESHHFYTIFWLRHGLPR